MRKPTVVPEKESRMYSSDQTEPACGIANSVSRRTSNEYLKTLEDII